MITYISNTDDILKLIGNSLGAVLDSERMLRTVATSMLPELRYRIHTEGKAADGGLISEKGYSDGYLEMREKANRGRSRKVILSFTGDMENDFSALPTDDGKGWGLGFKNPVNVQKALRNEQTYGKKVYALTKEEEVAAETILNEYITEALNTIQ